jgi:RNA polymerase sigma-70 factor (ECF subfamily)
MESAPVMSDLAVQRVRRVYESDHPRLWRSIYAYTGSRAIADDAAAEAFAQVLRRGDDVHDVAAWVWRSAFAIARGELQRRARSGAAVPEIAVEDLADDLADVLSRLEGLSPDDRELLVLCHVAGWKPRELAPVLGVPVGALRVRLHRATRRARELLNTEAVR